MKSRSGGVASRMASPTLTFPAIAGWIACSLMRSATGAITNIVRNRVRPMRTWFGGISCVPSACRRKWNTITMRVNDVMITSTAGRNDSSVRTMTICSGADTLPMPSTASFRSWGPRRGEKQPPG